MALRTTVAAAGGILALVLLLPVSGAAAGPDPAFDFAHAKAAIDYLREPGDDALAALAATAAAWHLKRHSDHTGYYAPDASALEISRDLVENDAHGAVPRMDQVRNLMRNVEQNTEMQEFCLRQARETLPPGFEFAHPLYVTWGYDIGVSMAGSSSLNIAHPRFTGHPGEVWFYCIHEMHHAGVMTFHAWPGRLSDIKTTDQMLVFIRYATFLEGSAVHAAYAARAEAGALCDDEDYVALGDQARLARYFEAYDVIVTAFEEAGNGPVTEADWALVEQLSDGDRLWYRVGAAMARKIDSKLGRAAYRRIIEHGPDAFFDAYRAGP